MLSYVVTTSATTHHVDRRDTVLFTKNVKEKTNNECHEGGWQEDYFQYPDRVGADVGDLVHLP